MKGFIELHFLDYSDDITPIIINLATISSIGCNGCIYFLNGDTHGIYMETYEDIKAKIEEATK